MQTEILEFLQSLHHEQKVPSLQWLVQELTLPTRLAQDILVQIIHLVQAELVVVTPTNLIQLKGYEFRQDKTVYFLR